MGTTVYIYIYIYNIDVNSFKGRVCQRKLQDALPPMQVGREQKRGCETVCFSQK